MNPSTKPATANETILFNFSLPVALRSRAMSAHPLAVARLVVVRSPGDGPALPLAFDLVRILNELIDDTDRLLARVVPVEIMDEREQLLFVHQREVDVLTVPSSRAMLAA